MSRYGGGGYLPDDCSECDICGEPMLGAGICGWCSREARRVYPKLGLDQNGKDKDGRDRSGLAFGYLKLHGPIAESAS